MQCIKKVKPIFILFIIAVFLPLTAWAAGELPHPSTYLPSTKDIMALKATYDDNKDLIETYHPKDILPPEVWATMNWDVDKMKALWAELVGFTTDERVGEMAPEIKPGKYIYKDVEQNPVIKELWPKYIQKTLVPGGPPIICNIMSFEIEPTRQFHLALPAAEATKRNLGKTKLDKDGYIVAGTWEGGIPLFPDLRDTLLSHKRAAYLLHLSRDWVLMTHPSSSGQTVFPLFENHYPSHVWEIDYSFRFHQQALLRQCRSHAAGAGLRCWTPQPGHR